MKGLTAAAERPPASPRPVSLTYVCRGCGQKLSTAAVIEGWAHDGCSRGGLWHCRDLPPWAGTMFAETLLPACVEKAAILPDDLRQGLAEIAARKLSGGWSATEADVSLLMRASTYIKPVERPRVRRKGGRRAKDV